MGLGPVIFLAGLPLLAPPTALALTVLFRAGEARIEGSGERCDQSVKKAGNTKQCLDRTARMREGRENLQQYSYPSPNSI